MHNMVEESEGKTLRHKARKGKHLPRKHSLRIFK